MPEDIGRGATGSLNPERSCRSVCKQSVDAGLIPNRRVSRHQPSKENHITRGSAGQLRSGYQDQRRRARGSDTVQSLLTFGASSIPSRGVLVDLQVEIGLYTAILSSTYRFKSAGVLSLINCPKRLGVSRQAARLDRVADWRRRRHVCGSSRGASSGCCGRAP